MGRPVAMKIGQRFGMLTVLQRAENMRPDQTRWVCQCDCGQTKVVNSSSLKCGNTKSCGCSTRLLNSLAHRRDDSIPAGPERNTWASMNARCYNPNAPDFALYGGRGIKVCDRWQRPHGYWNFVADMGPRPKGFTLDRIKSDGDYTAENCRWTDRRTQQNNRRYTRFVSYQGETLALGDWSRRTGIKQNVLWGRLYHCKWSVGQALGFEPHQASSSIPLTVKATEPVEE